MKILLLCFLCLFAVIPSFARPKLECEGAKFDFGPRFGGAPITNTFVLVNGGDEDVVVSKVKDCCGVSSTMTPMVIKPGASATCQTVFDTRNRFGRQSKQILVATNDRRKPYFELKMVGELSRPIEYEPKYFKLGVLEPAGELELFITATNMMEEAVSLNSVESTIPGIKAEVVPPALDVGGIDDPAVGDGTYGIGDPGNSVRGHRPQPHPGSSTPATTGGSDPSHNRGHRPQPHTGSPIPATTTDLSRSDHGGSGYRGRACCRKEGCWGA